MLTPRMETVAKLAGKNNSVADIGCDHGKLTVYLLKHNLAKKVYATDISEKSLLKAQILCEKEGLDNVSFFQGDGFYAFDEKPDCAVIAGMGGEIISRIILHNNAKTKLVLQPMKDSDILYKTLVENGFCINEVRIVREEGRFYEIILADVGKTESFDYSFPPMDKLLKDSAAKEFLHHKIKVLEKALRGAEKSQSNRAEELKNMINTVKGVIFDAYGQ